MTRVGIIGANGQVGAELCLLLRDRTDIELIPICRNRSGSAFLRWHGIACRHGRAADATAAAALFGDCDIVVNSSLASGTPAEIRGIEDRIINHMFAYSKADAKIIHFSTQSVYGDPNPERTIRWRNPYGRVKLESERQIRKAQRRSGKEAFILRLGHVCGALQDISMTIRDEILSGRIVLPARDRSSNTVYTVAIIHAVDCIIRRAIGAGTYDLMNNPAWTWKEVYEFEAASCGLPMQAKVVETARTSAGSSAVGSLSRFAASLSTSQPIRDMFAKLFAYVPKDLNARAMAWWYVKRAQRQIAELNKAIVPTAHLSWVANGVRPFPAAIPTIELLRLSMTDPKKGAEIASWPGDLPDAVAR